MYIAIPVIAVVLSHVTTPFPFSSKACFSGGLFALASHHAINGQSEHYMDIAKGLANVCHESYQRSGEIRIFLLLLS